LQVLPSSLYEPGLQAIHDAAPAPLNFPVGQGKHEISSAPPPYLPGSQAVHADEPATLYEPGSQVLQILLLSVYLPAPH
jgi:hypothetical protein